MRGAQPLDRPLRTRAGRLRSIGQTSAKVLAQLARPLRRCSVGPGGHFGGSGGALWRGCRGGAGAVRWILRGSFGTSAQTSWSRRPLGVGTSAQTSLSPQTSWSREVAGDALQVARPLEVCGTDRPSDAVDGAGVSAQTSGGAKREGSRECAGGCPSAARCGCEGCGCGQEGGAGFGDGVAVLEVVDLTNVVNIQPPDPG